MEDGGRRMRDGGCWRAVGDCWIADGGLSTMVDGKGCSEDSLWLMLCGECWMEGVG